MCVFNEILVAIAIVLAMVCVWLVKKLRAAEEKVRAAEEKVRAAKEKVRVVEMKIKMEKDGRAGEKRVFDNAKKTFEKKLKAAEGEKVKLEAAEGAAEGEKVKLEAAEAEKVELNLKEFSSYVLHWVSANDLHGTIRLLQIIIEVTSMMHYTGAISSENAAAIGGRMGEFVDHYTAQIPPEPLTTSWADEEVVPIPEEQEPQEEQEKREPRVVPRTEGKKEKGWNVKQMMVYLCVVVDNVAHIMVDEKGIAKCVKQQVDGGVCGIPDVGRFASSVVHIKKSNWTVFHSTTPGIFGATIGLGHLPSNVEWVEVTEEVVPKIVGPQVENGVKRVKAHQRTWQRTQRK